MKLDCTLDMMDSITGSKKIDSITGSEMHHLPMNSGFDTTDSITGLDRPRPSLQASFSTQELRDAFFVPPAASRPTSKIGSRSASKAGSRCTSRAGSANSRLTRSASAAQLSRPGSRGSNRNPPSTPFGDNVSQPCSLNRTLSMSMVLQDAVSSSEKLSLTAEPAAESRAASKGAALADSIPSSTQTADDILREELLRTRQEEDCISPSRFEALLSRLGGSRAAAATAPTPCSSRPPATPTHDDDYTKLAARTGLFLKRRGVR